MKFTRQGKIIKQLGIGPSVKAEFEDFGFMIGGKKYKLHLAMNDPFKDLTLKQIEEPGRTFYINPEHQDCLNSGSFTAEELRKFMKGDMTSRFLKDKNKEQRKKYWNYLKFVALDQKMMAWRLKHYFKWFDQMSTYYNPHEHAGFRADKIKNKLVLGANRRDEKEEKLRQERVITSMFAPFVNEIKHEFEYREWNHIEYEYRGYFYGIKRTLYCMGVGYMGASNIPENIRNLNWLTDVVYGKAYYLFLKDQEEKGLLDIKLPDFAWLSTRAYHGNGEAQSEQNNDDY